MKKRMVLLTVFLMALSGVLPVSAAFQEGAAEDLGAWVLEEPEEQKRTEIKTETKKENTGKEKPSDTDSTPAVEAVSGEIFTFNGKKYQIASDWGEHYLTGYCPNEDGSRGTASGRDATAGYTVSSTRANLGKVILVKAEKGSSRYDGVYLCEDTGGPAVETGQPNTMNTPVVDIFFDTAEEADNVTASGWITARIYILKEVK